MNPEPPGVSLNSISFKLLWWGTFLNTFGVAFSAGAISVLAIQELKSQTPLCPSCWVFEGDLTPVW
ncbi:Uncharacterised protein [Mycobacteroides abscessus subsp. bolletii]|nr:Uncharacterised protein [Mycobacteroides abscessus subsp. bolletii]